MIKELKSLIQFEYYPENQRFTWEGKLYVKWEGRPFLLNKCIKKG